MKGEGMMKKIKWLLTVPALLAPAASMAKEAAGEAAAVAGAVPDITEGWWHLWNEMMWDIGLIGGLFAIVIIYLLVKYRRKNSDEEGKGVKLSQLAAAGWIFIPAFLFIADDIFLAAKNFEQWQKMRTPPAESYEVAVEGYMWGFDITYPEGITATNELRVPEGKAIKVNLTSRDVVHAFFVPDYKVKWDMVPGSQTHLWFNAKGIGEHVLTCAEYCGPMHSGMYGKVIVMPEAEFRKWVEENKPKKAESTGGEA